MRAVDALSRQAWRDVEVEVAPAMALGAVATVTVSPDDPVSIAPPALAGGPEGDVSWSLSSGLLPDGLRLTSGGAIEGTAERPQRETVTLRAADATGTTVESAPFDVVVVPGRPGAFRGALTLRSGVPFQSEPAALPGGTPPFRWSVGRGDPLPDGVELRASTGRIAGTPGTSTGTRASTVVRTDAKGFRAVSGRIEIRVLAPQIVTMGDVEAAVGEPLSQAPEVSGAAIGPEWMLVGKVPGLAVDPATGALGGAPTVAGEWTVSLRLRDATGESVESPPFTVVVGDEDGGSPRVDARDDVAGAR